ncbi:peptidylprolyl isomerase [Arthrobacter echini]|uniref:Peptidylprolyl isomerase n=1 Tax=Arthrobacter echini TaxID=1529066 RepID=A0A4S5E375_9MICC|nr:SurA N-terminal domain-containing protein [Arthrobacter echini]THJ65820.1 peptidylprolyl isomerase [Arthrobacter echini]
MPNRTPARKRLLLAAAFIGSTALLGACSDTDDADGAAASAPAESTAEATPSTTAEAPPEPDLEDIPDVVATVNGTEIDREEFTSAYEIQFAQASTAAQLDGQILDQEQLRTSVADNLVSTELLRQEAEERGIDASPEALDAAVDDLLESSQLETEEDLRAAFAEQGLEDEEFDTQLADQVKLDALLAEEAGDIAPTDQEIQDTYDAAKAQQEEAGDTTTPIPPLEDVRDGIEEQLEGEKLSEAAQDLLAELREDADITVNL